MSADKEQEEFAHDWYGILGCDKNSSVAEIEKAARNSARKYHPDKNPDNPDAPALFLLVQKAKEILLDDTKRGIIDDFYKKKADLIASKLKRDSQMDVNRKRARDDLESKIKLASEPKVKLSQDEIIYNELKKRAANIKEIHKKNSSFIDEVNEYAQQAAYQKAQNFEKTRRTMEADDIINSCEIKIKWKRNAVSHSDDTLHQIFKKYGTIEQVVLRNGTSALITYSQESFAKLAVQAYANSQEFQVTLTSEKKKANIFTFDYKSQSQETDSKLAKEIARAVEKGKLEKTLSDLRGDNSDEWNGVKQKTERDIQIDYNSYLAKEADLFARVMQFEAATAAAAARSTEMNTC